MTALHFAASDSASAQEAVQTLTRRYGNCAFEAADVVVALGGDGFMLSMLRHAIAINIPVFGMNRGSVGFLMNSFAVEDLPARIAQAETVPIHPLRLIADHRSGDPVTALAINEVSLFRQTHQAAKLRVHVDGQERLAQLICDGILLSTPAGSTAYNLSAHGPIIPLGANVLALTPISAFRPRRWQGALLADAATVRIEVLELPKRPVSASADGEEVRDVTAVIIRSDPTITMRLMFDQGRGLGERIVKEQFNIY